MFWENIFLMFPPMTRPMLSRSTHFYCSFCFTNLEEYGQERCKKCLLYLNKREGMVIMDNNFDTKMNPSRKFYLIITSWFYRIVNCVMCCGSM